MVNFFFAANIKYNDHCRVCYKVGDLLCCETCPAVFHLHCLNPPLEQVPSEDWQCPICTAQRCKGVTDCVSELEKSGLLCRQVNLLAVSSLKSLLFKFLLKYGQKRSCQSGDLVLESVDCLKTGIELIFFFANFAHLNIGLSWV